jgi:hypothetical protein
VQMRGGIFYGARCNGVSPHFWHGGKLTFTAAFAKQSLRALT